MKFHILLLFYLLVVKTENNIFYSLAAFVRKKMFSPLKRKIYIFAPPLVCDGRRSQLRPPPPPHPSLKAAEKHSRLISEAGLISLLSHTTPCLVPRRFFAKKQRCAYDEFTRSIVVLHSRLTSLYNTLLDLHILNETILKMYKF